MANKPRPGEGLNDDQQAALAQIGKMMGPHSTGFDDRVQKMHDELHADEHANTDYDKEYGEFPKEASAEKMRAAQTGGASVPMGPSDIELAQVKQRTAGRHQAVVQGATQAAQAQAAQTDVNAPPAPAGPVGSTQPYPAQAGPQPSADVQPSSQASQPPAAPGAGPAPGAPGEDEEEG